MKYPKEIGPQSQTEALAILFSMLGSAYNLLAQYEADERARDEAERRERMREVFVDRPRREKMRTEAAHREDEAQ
jgi:hypothetical protein